MTGVQKTWALAVDISSLNWENHKHFLIILYTNSKAHAQTEKGTRVVHSSEPNSNIMCYKCFIMQNHKSRLCFFSRNEISILRSNIDVDFIYFGIRVVQHEHDNMIEIKTSNSNIILNSLLIFSSRMIFIVSLTNNKVRCLTRWRCCYQPYYACLLHGKKLFKLSLS